MDDFKFYEVGGKIRDELLGLNLWRNMDLSLGRHIIL